MGDREHDAHPRARHVATAARHPSHAAERPPRPRSRARHGRGHPPAPRAALHRGRDHASQQPAHAHADPAAPAARSRVELREALLERDEPAHARHGDGRPRSGGPLLAARAARGRGRTPRPLLPLLPRRLDLRGHLGDPAEHPRRARARPAEGAMTGGGPLAGIRVLDLGTRIGAPFAATLLADLGAEVIKVELPGQGDFMRTIGPFVDGYSLFWAVEGRNKKSITLDLRKPAGQELLKRLVRHADAIVENFQPGTLEGWGLGYDVLSAINPGIVLTRVSVYGQEGPYRDRPGLDRNGIAMGGLMYITGYPDRPPVRPGVIVSDYLTGVFNALSVVSALYERDRRARETGAPPRGQWVDLSLYESILRIMEHTLATYDRLGIVREREGNRLTNSAPLDNWETADGKFICIIAAGDGLFPRLARAMGREDLLADPRFTTMARRAEHGDEINALVAAWCRARTAREPQDVLERHEVPFGLAYSVADIFADPHIAFRQAITTVEDPVIGPVRMQGVYPRFSRTPGSIRGGAPRLGAHNAEVYGTLLGLTRDDLAALERDRVI